MTACNILSWDRDDIAEGTNDVRWPVAYCGKCYPFIMTPTTPPAMMTAPMTAPFVRHSLVVGDVTVVVIISLPLVLPVTATAHSIPLPTRMGNVMSLLMRQCLLHAG